MKKLIKIVPILMIIILSMSLVGCSQKGKPTKKVEEILNAYIAKDFNKLNGVFGSEIGKENEDMSEELETLLMDKLTDISYQVTEETIQENKATVKINAKVNDIATVFGKVIQEGMTETLALAFSGASEDDISKVFENKLKEKLTGDLQKVDKVATINLTKTDKEWVIDKENKEILDILLGDMGELNELDQ